MFKMAPGVYSESGEESEIEVLQARYPKSVLSLDSAYYYYDMPLLGHIYELLGNEKAAVRLPFQ